MSWHISSDWREQAEAVLARGRRADKLIPAFLLDSRVALLGFWWGRLVGWTWGLLWSRGRVERREGLWVFRGMPNWSFGRGGVCVADCFLTGDAEPSVAVLRHEAVHARQWRRYGILMPFLYFVAGRNPMRNRFEIEAGLEDGNYVPRGH